MTIARRRKRGRRSKLLKKLHGLCSNVIWAHHIEKPCDCLLIPFPDRENADMSKELIESK